MVLIVEDYKIVSLHVKSVLERAGYTVPATFVSGEDLIEYMESANPDVVLMDVMLEGELDGINTIDTLRSEHNFPVIFLTALSDTDSLSRISTISNSTLINKPFDEGQLLDTVKKAVSQGFE